MAILSVVGFILIGGMLTSLSVYVSVMQPHFHWNEAEMGAGPVALLLGMSAGTLCVGWGMNRLGVRGLFSFGAAVAVCGWIAAGFIRSLPEFMVAMALAGLGAGVATIMPGIAVISQSFHRRKGLAIALFIGACALASSTMPMISGWLIDALGWRGAFWTMGTAAALIFPGLLYFLPRAAGATSPSNHRREDQPGLTKAQALNRPDYWILVAILTISQLCMNAVLFNMIAYFRKSGFDQTEAVTIYGIANLMSLPGLVIGGFVSDRISARILLPLILTLQAVGTFALLGIGDDHLWQGRIAIGLFILAWGGVAGLPAQAGSMLLGEMIGPRAFASLLGIIFTINGFVGALAPVAIGWAYEVTHGYFLPIFFLGALAALAALTSFFCWTGHGRLTSAMAAAAD